MLEILVAGGFTLSNPRVLFVAPALPVFDTLKFWGLYCLKALTFSRDCC
jgi:hypothetical protein